MTWITDMLNQTVTYWSPGTVDNYGDLSFNTPVTMNGRWENSVELVTDSKGREFTSRARVYLFSDVENEGYLFLGTSAVADPTTLEGAYLIRFFSKIPDIDAIDFERKAFV